MVETLRGFNTVHRQLVKIIRQVDPKAYDRDQRFICIEDGEGRAAQLEAALVGDRYFDIRMISPPHDAGYTGQNGEVNWVKLEIRVRYNTGNRGRREGKAGVDIGTISQAILFPPNWDGPTSGIRTMRPPAEEDMQVEKAEEDDEDEGILKDTILAKMQLLVQYLEEHTPSTE